MPASGRHAPLWLPPSPERSRNMAAIRSRDTKPELVVRSQIHRAGFRYSLHRKDLPGKPDLVLSRYGVVVFVHGCFWHGHHCVDGHIPKSNKRYWAPKIAANITRDKRRRRQLGHLGWTVLVVRECRLARDTGRVIRLLEAARGGRPRRSVQELAEKVIEEH